MTRAFNFATKYAQICACFGMSVGAFPDAERTRFASAPDAESAFCSSCSSCDSGKSKSSPSHNLS